MKTYAQTRHSAPTRHTPSTLDNARAKANRADEIKRAREALIEQIDDACNFSLRTTTLDEFQILAAITIVKSRWAQREI